MAAVDAVADGAPVNWGAVNASTAFFSFFTIA